jgi:uncharacterized protein YkwD
LKRLQLLVTLALLIALAMTAAPAPASAAKSLRGDRMMDSINWARAQAGLRPLRRSRRLVRSSAARAELLMRADYFAHPTYLRVPTFDRVGEVLELHGGLRPRTNRTLRLWGNSPGHHAVIMSRRYRWMGAARAVGRYRGARATIWVVRFGKH